MSLLLHEILADPNLLPPPSDPLWRYRPVPVAPAASHPPALTEEQLDQILRGSSSFSFHFQPIVDLQRAAAVGFEALARFSFPGPCSDQRVPPNLVFDAASSFGRRLELEEKVLSAAIAARRLLPPNCFLSVNVGPSYLLSDRFDRLLSGENSLRGIVFEITEDEVIADYTALQKKLDLIRLHGGSAAVDDAGSGYCSLKHIMEIRPNFIKLDRSFINGCNFEPAKAVLIDMIGKAANRLDAWIIAEGIENSGELDELLRLTVPLGQGFYLGRPEPSMRHLQQEKADSILARVEVQVPTLGIQRAIESCVLCNDRAEAQSRLQDHPAGGVAVICDGDRQPIETLEQHPLLGFRSLSQCMKVQADSEAAEVLHRALTRPIHLRYDPLLVVNARGECTGVVHLDRLIRETIGPA
jgi:EAL domain-containing protein (putative c-di-GMP-specific phosphodiesterase class I)